MLIQNDTAQADIRIEKLANGHDASRLGAFACGTRLTLRLQVPRRLGASAVVLRICRDGEGDTDMPLAFVDTHASVDTYELTLDTAALCGECGHGLFYYEYLFLRGLDTLFSDSINNVDMTLSQHSACRFRLLIHEAGYETPDWFKGGTMYHVFVDRFFRGAGAVEERASAVINSDWENGIPQYAPIAGAPLSNNVFFGGNLWGVAEKLDRLASLGVSVLYLSPVFAAYSNHRYDTADYEKIDGLLGGDEAFDHLIREAHARGMRVILDGVFNHTGDDSRYFNRRGTYPEVGAYQSRLSPYARWFSFRNFPNEYECWWNIEIMPRLQHANEECRHYFTAAGGICEKWLLRGADGWRLDVADELSDEFLDELRATVKAATDGEGLIIGEVWENAADKIAYGKRRRYFGGRQLDSVMNYPFRNAVLALLQDGDAETFYNILTELYGSYPTSVSHSLMNLLGTHDTERFLTTLGDSGRDDELSNDELARRRLSPEDRAAALQKMKLAATLQFTVFGVPSVYYGDEAGLEGYHDPFCRMPYPWGREDEDLLSHYRALGALRQRSTALKNGDFRFTHCQKDAFAYERVSADGRLLVVANVGATLHLPLEGAWNNALTGDRVDLSSGALVVPPMSALVLESC
ncbi:MAG: glycoside hydrolase family 13 protein [Clostridia bacterium]|nr:glycoside hydrolase family 13 protein [Clostridia bacterium]